MWLRSAYQTFWKTTPTDGPAETDSLRDELSKRTLVTYTKHFLSSMLWETSPSYLFYLSLAAVRSA